MHTHTYTQTTQTTQTNHTIKPHEQTAQTNCTNKLHKQTAQITTQTAKSTRKTKNKNNKHVHKKNEKEIHTQAEIMRLTISRNAQKQQTDRKKHAKTNRKDAIGVFFSPGL